MPVRRPLFALAVLLPALILPTLAVPALASSADATTSTSWVGTWATAPVAETNTHHLFAEDTTLRQTLRISIGGSTLRVVLSNELGTDPLTISAASINRTPSPSPAPDSAPTTTTPTITTAQPSAALTFSGHPTVVIPPGAVAVSDPIALDAPALSLLTVNLFLPAQTLTTLTLHPLALETNSSAPGNQLTAPTLSTPLTFERSLFLKDIEVQAPSATSIVAFGDSITDGYRSTSGARTTWPDILANRLHANASTANLGVLNQGIGGNRILHDGFGPNALARFDRDVLAPAGVHYLILLEGINDIGHAYTVTHPTDVVTAADLIAGLSQLARRAHTHNIKVFGATLTPFVGAGYASPAGEAVRQAVNQWIRTSPELDGVLDFDKATRDPANPAVLAPANDSGDHLHPNDAGYKAMGDSIDLKLFTH